MPGGRRAVPPVASGSVRDRLHDLRIRAGVGHELDDVVVVDLDLPGLEVGNDVFERRGEPILVKGSSAVRQQDQERPTGPQDTVEIVDGPQRVRQVFQDVAADDEVLRLARAAAPGRPG